MYVAIDASHALDNIPGVRLGLRAHLALALLPPTLAASEGGESTSSAPTTLLLALLGASPSPPLGGSNTAGEPTVLLPPLLAPVLLPLPPKPIGMRGAGVPPPPTPPIPPIPPIMRVDAPGTMNVEGLAAGFLDPIVST